MKQGIHDGVPEADYFTDPALSQSQMKTLLDCPARYRWEVDHPEQRETRAAFDLGHAVHSKVLGVGAPFVAIDVDARRGKAWTEPADAARAEGRIPLLRKDADAVDAMSESVLAGKARALFEGEGANEQTVAWDEGGVDCRGRIDRLTPHGIVDLKSAADASPGGFGKSAANYRYDLQQAAYVRGVEVTTGEALPFVFVAVEKAPPYPVGLYILPPEAVERGEDSFQSALDIYRRCRDTGQWPDYPTDVTELRWPRWAA